MKLPKSFTTVTPLSKTLALILFIALPIFAFAAGMKYQAARDSLYYTILLNQNKPQKIVASYEQPDFSPLYFSPPSQTLVASSLLYRDTIFPISFKYPKQYTLAAYPADDIDGVTHLFFLENDTDDIDERKAYIDGVVDCWKNPPPEGGICAEGLIATIEATIWEFSGDRKEIQKVYEKDKYCRRDDVSGAKIVYSCLTRSLPGTPAYRFITYISYGGKTYGIEAETQSDAHADAIMTIIDTLTMGKTSLSKN
jgi:hypothetical protein